MSESANAGTTGGAKKTQRRWRIPQPLLRDAASPGPEGLSVLDEFPSELGMVLLKSLRSVLLWAGVEPSARPGLFDEHAPERRQVEILSTVPEEEGELRVALEELLPVLSRPEHADPERVGLACIQISQWAQGRAAARTSLEFVQAAALACPANARFGLLVGRGARDLAQYGRAEAWLHRSVGLARQVDDWETYIRAYLTHGMMMMRRGALPAARRSFIKAQRRATRQGIRALEAMAFHDLFALAVQGGDLETALSYAEKAAKAYGPTHGSFPNFAHDVAYLWMQQGEYEHAYPVFLAALDRVEEGFRPFVLGSLGRAAAGRGDREAFEKAATELESYASAPGVAEAWVEIARAGVILGDHEDARKAAERAESLASGRREGQVRFMAESVLETAEADARALEAQRGEATEAPHQVARRNRLARSLLRSLGTVAPSR